MRASLKPLLSSVLYSLLFSLVQILAAVAQAEVTPTTQKNLEITAVVVSSCTITDVQPISLQLDVTSTIPAEATSTMKVTCTKGASYEIRADKGKNPTGVGFERRLKHDSQDVYVPYKLSVALPSTNPLPLGDGVDTKVSVIASGAGSGLSSSHFLYFQTVGSVASLAGTLVAGTYRDTVGITISIK